MQFLPNMIWLSLTAIIKIIIYINYLRAADNNSIVGMLLHGGGGGGGGGNIHIGCTMFILIDTLFSTAQSHSSET